MIWLLAYLIGFAATAIAVIRFESGRYNHTDVDDQILVGLQGFLAGIMWPLVLVCFALYRLATRNSTKGK